MAAVVFGQVLDGAEAARVGLVYRCVAEDELLDQAQAFAHGAASAPRELAIVTKQTIRDMADIGTHPTPSTASSSRSSGACSSRGSPSGIAALQAKISSKP